MKMYSLKDFGLT